MRVNRRQSRAGAVGGREWPPTPTAQEHMFTFAARSLFYFNLNKFILFYTGLLFEQV